MATKPIENADEFGDAFASFAQENLDGGVDPAPAAEDPAPAVDPAPVAEDPAPAVDPAPVAEDPAPAGGDPAPAPAPVAEDPSAADALIERLSQVLQERPAEPVRQEPAAAEPAAEVYSADERDFLTRYEEDWSDVSRGEQLKRRQEYRELVGFVFNQIASQVQPLTELVDVLASRSQLSDLRNRVENYDDIRDQVIGWVGKQPVYLQTAYNSVIQNGTVDEVADLVDRFRKDTGAAPPAPAAEPKIAELSDATKKAVAALAPVSTKRSAVPQAEDDGDFDSAFARFAEVLKK